MTDTTAARLTLSDPVTVLVRPYGDTPEPPQGRSAQWAVLRNFDPAEPRNLDIDDDPVGELDHDSIALLTALNEFDILHARAWDPAKHPRNPKGSPGGGKFKSIAQRITDAIEAHLKGDGNGDPFPGFDREQLRKVAKARGIELKRGESRDSIVKKLLADLKGGKPEVHKPAVKKAPHKPSGYHAASDIGGSADYPHIAAALAKADSRDPADHALSRVQDAQGFNGLPAVVSRAEFGKAKGAGDVTEVWRGLNGAGRREYAEQFRSGDHFPGVGVYGNGTYVAMARADAEKSGDEMLRIGLRRDANVISIDDLRKKMDAYTRANAARKRRADELDKEMRRVAERANTTAERIAVYDRYRALKADALGAEYLVRQDAGRFAALLGYDAIDVPGGQGGAQMVILNRTAVIVEEATP